MWRKRARSERESRSLLYGHNINECIVGTGTNSNHSTSHILCTLGRIHSCICVFIHSVFIRNNAKSINVLLLETMYLASRFELFIRIFFALFIQLRDFYSRLFAMHFFPLFFLLVSIPWRRVFHSECEKATS